MLLVGPILNEHRIDEVVARETRLADKSTRKIIAAHSTHSSSGKRAAEMEGHRHSFLFIIDRILMSGRSTRNRAAANSWNLVDGRRSIPSDGERLPLSSLSGCS